MEKVRLGIIGIGSMGTGHAGNVLKGMVPDMELTAVADIRQSRLDWARNNLPETVKVFDDGRKMIDSGSCDAVLVATPHYLHPEFVIYALEHGLHAISEKPAGVYTKQVREMNEAAERSDRSFAIMLNQRTNCVYLPDVIVGDFDSASKVTVGVYRKMAKKMHSIQFVDLDTHKDFTDTHVAIMHAMEEGATDIYISGATGTRLDHTMANIGLLKECADKGVNAYIEDDHNVITMINSSAGISRLEGYDYISFIPYGGCVTGVTLTGFEYNVENRTFEIGDSLGVSNRVVSEDARIEIEDGYMIVNYSRD